MLHAMKRFIACSILLATTALAVAEPLPLIDVAMGVDILNAKLNDAELSNVAGDRGQVLEMTTGEGGEYPGIELAAPGGAWDLSAYNAVEVDLVNAGAAPTRVHARVDNPGDWRKNPWSINAISLKPGEAKTLKVAFGRSYGNPGFELDPAKVKQIVIFAEKPKQPATIRITAIRAVGQGATTNPAATQPATAPTAAATATSTTAATSEAILDFDGDTDVSAFYGDSAEFAVVEANDGKALEVSFTGGDYPAVQMKRAEGPWDLSSAKGLSAEVTNTSPHAARVHLRVDNPGDWRKQPWNTDAQTVKPGETKTIKVTFGKSYGNPGFALDASKVSQVVVFTEKPKPGTKILVDNVRPITGDAAGAAPASASTAAAAPAEPAADAVAPAGSGVLYGFDDAASLTTVRGQGAKVEHTTDGGGALRAIFASGESYPGVHLEAPQGAWNLSNYAGVQVDITNPNSFGVTAALRVDNPGDWSKNQWNAEKLHIKAGQTQTVRVKFGQSWGAPGFSLNPARVARCLVYLERPKDGTTLVVDNLKAYGQATVREADTVDLDGNLFDFGGDFILDGRVEERGATAALESGKLVATFDSGEQWPAVYLKPLAKKWDLALFESIEVQVSNVGTGKARVMARVDNPGADGTKNCNTEAITLDAGQTQTLKVTFGKSWGNAGFALDPSNVVGVLVMVDQPKQQYRIAIDDVKANRRQWAELPAWIGTRPPVDGDWVPTLQEEFDSAALDETKWTPRLVWDGPNPAETQRYLEENVQVRDGKLVITCEKNPGHQYDDPKLPTRQYATGAVTSLDKWTQTYGYFEARIKRPSARGLWPAFWMMPDRGAASGKDIWGRRDTSNGGMEIDIWEHLTEWGPNRYNIAAHWDGYDKDHKQWGNAHVYHLPTQDGWHHYGLLWEPGKLTWFCDGRKVAEWANERVTSLPAYLKFTVQMGNWATSNVDDAALPDEFQIDYVRAWQLRERVR